MTNSAQPNDGAAAKAEMAPLIQMPIFRALYSYADASSVELSGTSLVDPRPRPHRDSAIYILPTTDGRNDVLHPDMSPTTVTDPDAAEDRRPFYAGHRGSAPSGLVLHIVSTATISSS